MNCPYKPPGSIILLSLLLVISNTAVVATFALQDTNTSSNSSFQVARDGLLAARDSLETSKDNDNDDYPTEEDKRPGALPIILLICATLILMTLCCFGAFLCFYRLVLDVPAPIVDPSAGQPSFKRGVAGVRGIKGGTTDPKLAGVAAGGGVPSSPKSGRSAQTGQTLGTTNKRQVSSGKVGAPISFERMTLKSKQSKRSSHQPFGKGFKAKQKHHNQGGKNRGGVKKRHHHRKLRRSTGTRVAAVVSTTSRASTATGHSSQNSRYGKSGHSGAKGKHGHYGRGRGRKSKPKGPGDQTLLYKQSVQYYKQFLKSIHSVKSVSEYFDSSRNSRN